MNDYATMKVYELKYSDPRWNETTYVVSSDEALVRQYCEKLIQNYGKDLSKDENDIELMNLELPLEYRWNDNEFAVTDAGNVAKSGKWHRTIADVCYDELEVVDLDAQEGT